MLQPFSKKDNPNFELSIPKIPLGHNLLNLFIETLKVRSTIWNQINE